MVKINKILVTASTFPAHEDDPVPRFVKDHVIAMHRLHPETKFDVLAPHNAYTRTLHHKKYKHFTEYRFHYFWPFTNLELLTGRAIVPTLKQKPILYLQVPFLFIATAFATWKHIAKHSPDLVYAHWFTPQGIAAALACMLTGKKFIFTSHSGDVIIWRKVPFARHLVRWVCDRAFAYTAVSQQTADKLLSMLPDGGMYRDKLSIIPMGTNLPPEAPKLSGLNKPIQLFFIGRLVSIKGVDCLLDGLAGLANREFHLTIAGDGQERQSLELLASRLGLSDKVTFTGFVTGDTKESLFGKADVVCIPSIKEGDNTEGLPVTLMESLAAGKVVVASDVTGAQEYITSGKDGFLFRQGDSKELASKLSVVLQMSNKERDAIGTQAYRLSRSFDWPFIAKQHYRIFEKCRNET